jgi:hypothetical protein
MTYTTLREAEQCVRRKEEFTGNNIYARWMYEDKTLPNQELCPMNVEPVRYVVYSYGTHFPMYIWDRDTGMWYGNKDKYSSTTSRHQSACHPPHVDAWYDTAMMEVLARAGMVGATKARVLDAAA